jgi:hypothetical protein
LHGEEQLLHSKNNPKHNTLKWWFNLTLKESSAVSSSILQVINGRDELRRRKYNMFHTNKVDFPRAHKKTVVHTYVVCSQMQYIKPRTQIRTYNAEKVFKLLNSSEKEFVEIQKQTALGKLKGFQKGPQWFQSCLKYVDSLNLA